MKAEEQGSGDKAGGGGKEATAGGSSSADAVGSSIVAGTDDEPMNISTVGESMEELKLMHQVMPLLSKSSTNSQDASTSSGVHETAKKVQYSIVWWNVVWLDIVHVIVWMRKVCCKLQWLRL